MAGRKQKRSQNRKAYNHGEHGESQGKTGKLIKYIDCFTFSPGEKKVGMRGRRCHADSRLLKADCGI